jgi:hypothetical protein
VHRIEQKADQHVLGSTRVAVAIAQPIEQNVGEDVPEGDDRGRGEPALHAQMPSRPCGVARLPLDGDAEH